MLIVQKYGGTSVGDADRIKNVARRVCQTKEAGHDVVVVVSAMSGETDKLLNLAAQVSDSPDPREMDMLVSTGERVTIALLSMAIHAHGYGAQSFTGRQAGIFSDSVHMKARIEKITGEHLLDSEVRGNFDKIFESEFAEPVVVEFEFNLVASASFQNHADLLFVVFQVLLDGTSGHALPSVAFVWVAAKSSEIADK